MGRTNRSDSAVEHLLHLSLLPAEGPSQIISQEAVVVEALAG